MLRFGIPVEIGSAEGTELVLRNFHAPEPGGFAWSAGRWCEVSLRVARAAAPRDASLALTLDLDVFRHPPLLPSQDILIYLNGLRLGALTVSRRQVVAFGIRRAALLDGTNLLAIDTPEATRPVEVGQEDGRLLGVQLFAVGIEATLPPQPRPQRGADDRAKLNGTPWSTRTAHRA